MNGTEGDVEQRKLSFVHEWELKVGVANDHPSFEALVRDRLAMEPKEYEDAVLHMLGIIELPKKRIPFDGSYEPSWMEQD